MENIDTTAENKKLESQGVNHNSIRLCVNLAIAAVNSVTTDLTLAIESDDYTTRSEQQTNAPAHGKAKMQAGKRKLDLNPIEVTTREEA